MKSQLNSDLIFVNCLFNGNFSNSDSAVSFNQGSFEMINCTLHANTADNNQTCITLSNCTGQPQITHSIFWQNGTNNISSNNCDPNIRYCCIEGGYGGYGNFDENPIFANPAGQDGIIGNSDDNLQLSIDSPCIDAGNNFLISSDFPDLDSDNNIENEPLPFDIIANLRQVDVPLVEDTGYSYFPGAAVVDIGAYEYQAPPPIAGDIDSDGDVDFSDFCELANNWLNGI